MLSADRKQVSMAGPSVTSRVASVLAAFGAEHSAMTLSELARRTALPLTTVHRLTGELTRHGLLERDDQQRYRIGLRLWEIAATASRGVDLRDAAMPVLQDLYSGTRANVQLAVLDGAEVIYLERLSGPEWVHVVTRPGSRLPVHASGVGLVLLAHAPVEVQDEVLAAPLARYTRYTITDPKRLRRMLSDVRRDGFVISDRQIETISVSVAAGDPRGYVKAVTAAAAAISRRLPILRQPGV
jgi:DNA-binding IclR family transcriptional regulator